MSFRLPTVSGITQTVTQLGNSVTRKGGDGKYFHSTKKGEIQELKDELHSQNKEKKKEAVKKVIAAMTIGKDVSGLFPDVVNCMQTTNIELKKLVYLYVINYAKVQPELAILAVNTFRKDSLDPNPLIRALAVRTMGCIRLEQVVEYIVEPLRRACRDGDPYVRKTAATCICKLYDTSPEAVEEQGFLDILKEMITDANPMVVGNAVAALMEVSESSGVSQLVMTEHTVQKLLTALSECTEWGQTFILDALGKYTPSSHREACQVVERITARLSHANAAVVMSTIRVLLRMLEHVTDTDVIRATHKKLGPPLVTLLSAEPEIQYVALRNISLVLRKHPNLLANEVKMFFCKYNDPHYVKMEKLEILIRLTTEQNIDQVLLELREYATEVDVEFVRRTIRAIGRCAIKLEKAAEKCIGVLIGLIETKVNYVVQETIVVIKDVFRKYPNRYESVISSLCENLESLDEPEAKASMIWIIGEYAERIANADELLETFLDGFYDEPTIVRQQILTATVKLFLKSPRRTQDLVTKVLKMTTEGSDDPDLRDRGYIYWRLLSTNPEATKKVVLSDRPPISDYSFALDPIILIDNISSLASVFHKLPESFVTRLRKANRNNKLREDTSDTSSSNVSSDDEGLGDKVTPDLIKEEMTKVSDYDSGDSDGEDDEDEDSGSDSSSEPSDLLDLGSSDLKGASTDVQLPPNVPRVMLLSPNTPGSGGAKGLGIMGALHRYHGQIYLSLLISNNSPSLLPSSGWAVQINKNSFGLAVGGPMAVPDLLPGRTAESHIKVVPNENLSQLPPSHPLQIQIAIKSTLDVFYLSPLTFPLTTLFLDRKAIDKNLFKQHWQRMGEAKQISLMSLSPVERTSKSLTSELSRHNINLVVLRQQDAFDTLYFSAVATNNLLLLIEISLQKGADARGVKLAVRSDSPQMLALIQSALVELLGLEVKV